MSARVDLGDHPTHRDATENGTIEALGVDELAEVTGQQVDRIRYVVWIRRFAVAPDVVRNGGVRATERLQLSICCRVIGECAVDEDDGWPVSSPFVVGLTIVGLNRGHPIIYTVRIEMKLPRRNETESNIHRERLYWSFPC